MYAYTTQGSLYLMQHQPVLALEYLQRARELALSPQLEEVDVLHMKALLLNGQVAAAEAHLR